MADERFRLPGSSYEQLTRIVKAYNLMRGPVGPADVARPLGIDSTIVSRNNGFLLGAGLVGGGNKKSLTDRGEGLARALEYDVEDEIRNSWREVVRTTDFLKEIVDAVRIRGGMLPPALQSHIAYSAKQPSSSTTKTGAGTVVEILRLAGAIAERDGKFVATAALEENAPAVPEAAPAPDPAASAPDQPQFSFDVTPAAQGDSPSITVALNVNIECTIDELPLLGQRLSELQAKLRNIDPDDA